MYKQDNLLVGLFGLFLGSILLLRVMIGAPAIGRDESYIFLQTHWLATSINALPEILFVLLPVVLGMACLKLFLSLLARYKVTNKKKYLSTLFFALSPVVITTFTTYNETMIVSVLALTSLVVPRTLASIPLLLLSATSPLAGILVALVLAAQFIHEKQLVATATLLGPVLLGAILYDTTRVFSWVGLFGEFASIKGYSLFLLLLGVVALVEHWNKLNLAPIIAWSILFVVSGFVVELRVLLIIPLAVYASQSLVTFFTNEWTLGFLRQASIILLACVALFVLITHTQLLVNEQPGRDVAALVEFIEESSRQGTLLTTQGVSGYTEYSLSREVITFSSDDRFWEEVRLTTVGPVLTRHDVRYLLFEQRFREKGFFFLLTTNDKFIRVSQEGDYELWLVLQEYVPSEEEP